MLRGTGGAAPRGEWARPTVELFEGCPLWDFWCEYVGADSTVSYGVVDAAGSMLPLDDGDIEQLLDRIDAGKLSLMSVHRHALRQGGDRPDASVRMTYFGPTSRRMLPGWMLGPRFGSLAVRWN